MRNFIPALLFVLALTTNSLAGTHVLHASAVPEPGILIALGGGLVGLATIIRRRFLP